MKITSIKTIKRFKTINNIFNPSQYNFYKNNIKKFISKSSEPYLAYSNPGIFGLNSFQNAKSITDSAKNAIEQSKLLINKIINNSKNIKNIEYIDKISNSCCQIIDGSTAVYHLHPKDDFKKSAFEAINYINNYFDELNHNKQFYNASLELFFSDHVTAGLLIETEMNMLLKKNIEELTTFHKDKNSNDFFLELIETKCSELDSPSNLDVNFYIYESELANISSQVLKALFQIYIDNYKKNEKNNNNKDNNKVNIKDEVSIENDDGTFVGLGKKLTFKADYNFLMTVMKKSNLEDLRNRAYLEISNFGQQNINKFMEILKLRLKFAQSLGFKSFSEYQIKSQTFSQSPKVLVDHLKELWLNLKPNLIIDLSYVYKSYENLQKKQTDDNSEEVKTNNEVKEKQYKYLNHFEIDFLKSNYIDHILKSSQKDNEENIAKKYITTKNVFDGLSLLTRTLFKKELVPILDPEYIDEEVLHESILHCNIINSYPEKSNDTPVKKPKKKNEDDLTDDEAAVDIKKEIYSQPVLGKVYFDLFVRDGKFRDLFSQFTIQGSKNLNFYNYKFSQIPITILASNFEVKDYDLLNMNLGFTEAKSIFHEYGHTMHSVLSKTDFQFLSGNRIPLDFAEIPSHLFEYFLYDYNFCKLWMIDAKTKEPIPEDIHSLFCVETRMFSNLDLQETLYYSVLDLSFHMIEKEEDINIQNLLRINKTLIKDYYINSNISFEKRFFEDFYRLLRKYGKEINQKYAIDKFMEVILEIKNDKAHNLEFNKELNELIKTYSQNETFLNEKQSKETIYNEDFIFTTIPHFKNYPSNYYTYIFGKAISNVIWTDTFLKGYSKAGEIFEKEFLSKGFTNSPLNLIKNYFKKF